MDDYVHFLDDILSSVSTNEPSVAPAASPLAALAGADTDISAIAEARDQEELKRQSSLALAIWASWHSGDLSQFDDLFDLVESYHPLGIDISQIRPISLDLKDWIALCPPRGYPEAHSQSHLPLSPEPDAPILTWRKYAETGDLIVSRKRMMTPVQCQAHISQSAARLLAAMLLDPDRSGGLRDSFYIILTHLVPILRDEVRGLEAPSRRFAKYFPSRLSVSEERETVAHSEQRYEAAMLAMVCDRELKALGIYTSAAFKEAGAIFSDRCTVLVGTSAGMGGSAYVVLRTSRSCQLPFATGSVS